MNITDEQAESDAAKVKALRTSVGWFSSPALAQGLGQAHDG